MFPRTIAPAMALLCISIGAAMAATPQQPYERSNAEAVQDAFWTVRGGEFKLRFNHDLLDLFGVSIRAPRPTAGQHVEDLEFSVFSVRTSDGLVFNAPEGGFDRFVGGLLRIEGGFQVVLPDGEILDQRDVQLRVSRHNPMHLELVGADGHAWFYLDHLMYKMIDDYSGFYLRTADLRVSPMLASRIGAPELLNAYVAEVKMTLEVTNRPAGFDPEGLRCANPNFHGNPIAGGGTYQADVLMESYSMSFSRCRRGDTGANGCDGAGDDDGEVVFTPSATLRNSNTSTTADVPWYRKFTTSPYNYPYPGNDQHPYLVWNMYRITDGQLEQIGASGVKHAFLTINVGCAPGACTAGGHILGRNCGDTYGTGNNDSNSDLGPRHELVPSTGYWGRCGSIYDTACNGSQNASGNTNYDQRLVVRESQMLVAGSAFYSEAWYVVQDDINIYNTMAHRTMNPVPGGSGWVPNSGGQQWLGPVINTWVDPVAHPTRNVEIATDEGHTRVAVKVKTLDACPAESGLSGTCYRYDYAVNNFDFSRAVLGDPPNDVPPNLRVVSNKGFDSFTIPVPESAAYLPEGHFADIDIDAGNNWGASFGPHGLTWTAPKGNELDWGHLYRFSFVSNVAPDEGHTGGVVLGVAGPGRPTQLTAQIMVPDAIDDLDFIFANGFDDVGGGNDPVRL